jgi:DNA-binding HxlR family transcriptional regulator
MRRTSFAGARCPVARSLDVIGDWWSLLIVREAFDGARRFTEFREELGIAKGMLTARLRELVDAGVLQRNPATDGANRQEYVLTEKGRGLFPVIVALRQWGEDHLYDSSEPHSILIDRKSGKPVRRMQPTARNGRALSWSDTRVEKVRAGRRGAVRK